MAKASALTDNFTADTLNTGKWTDMSGGALSLASDRLTLQGTSAYHHIVSATTWDLTNSHFIVEVPDPGVVATVSNFEIIVMAQLDGSNDYHFMLGYNTCICRGREANPAATQYANPAFNATNHRWLRLRETNGTIFFEVSSNGASNNWTTLHSRAAAFSLAAVSFLLQVGKWDWVSPDPINTASFDNVNIPRVPPVMRRRTRFFSRKF